MHFKMNQLIRINFNGGQHLSELSWTASDRFSVKEIETIRFESIYPHFTGVTF